MENVEGGKLTRGDSLSHGRSKPLVLGLRGEERGGGGGGGGGGVTAGQLYRVEAGVI